MTKIKRQNVVILLIAMLIYLGNVMCITLGNATLQKGVLDKKKFAGSATCASCHNEIYKSHIETAHYRDSRPASKESIKGSFAPGKNKYVYNKWTEVVLEQKDNKFFQTAHINGIEYLQQPFDIVIGSGRKGQTYLYWQENDLFQLPVSYYTPLDSWCNSPGFPNAYVRYNRPVSAKCLECHTTFAKQDEPPPNINTFDKTQAIIYGVDCERCHGPAAEHVAFHQQNPGEKKGRFIINAKNMDRQPRLDACALCHSGFRDPIKPAFSFMVGDKLDDFSTVGYNMDSVSTLDVHGNQYGLLTSSKCFKASLQMDCSSCHNPHVNEFNNKKIFSERCMTCHNDAAHTSCKLPPAPGLVLSENCIDCHMPVLASEAIKLNVTNADKLVPDPVRTHRIDIYPEKTKEYIDTIKFRKK
ncbi:MAG: multiheme c-type cytochrome [Chitinophagaceae bacterium]